MSWNKDPYQTTQDFMGDTGIRWLAAATMMLLFCMAPYALPPNLGVVSHRSFNYHDVFKCWKKGNGHENNLVHKIRLTWMIGKKWSLPTVFAHVHGSLLRVSLIILRCRFATSRLQFSRKHWTMNGLKHTRFAGRANKPAPGVMRSSILPVGVAFLM